MLSCNVMTRRWNRVWNGVLAVFRSRWFGGASVWMEEEHFGSPTNHLLPTSILYYTPGALHSWWRDHYSSASCFCLFVHMRHPEIPRAYGDGVRSGVACLFSVTYLSPLLLLLLPSGAAWIPCRGPLGRPWTRRQAATRRARAHGPSAWPGSRCRASAPARACRRA